MDDTVDVFYTSQLDTLPISSTEIRRDTMSDPTLSRVLEMVTTGHFLTTKDAGDELSPYLIRRHDLTIQHGCLMWGIRVIVPPKLCPRVPMEHTAHPRVVRIRLMARYRLLDRVPGQILPLLPEGSKRAMSCSSTPLETWPSSPWERIHMDFVGPFEGHMYLVVDAHSKWPEVHTMDNTTANNTIQVLRGLFSRYGIPHSLVSDNRPQFFSE